MRIVWAICRKITKNCNYINKCQSVHQSTYQPFKKWASQLINLTVCLSVNQPFKQFNQATQVINQTLFHQWINHSNSFSTIQLLILDAIHDSWFLHELRIKNREKATENRVEDQVSRDRKQKINPWLIDPWLTQHSMVIFEQATVCLEKDQFKL